MDDICIGGSCPDCGAQYGEHTEHCQVAARARQEFTEIERLKKENAELLERIKRLETLASRVGWGNEAEDKFVQED